MVRNPDTPYLVEDTSSIGRDRRIEEQAGTRAVTGARVIEKDHTADYQTTLKDQGVGRDYLAENGVEPHPILAKNQAYDGREKNLNVDTTLNPLSKEEIENELRLQHQLQMSKKAELTNTFNPRPF